MNYYKWFWNETTGEPLTDAWGTSVYYIETGDDNFPTRQLVIYENGTVLKYDSENLDDEYGGLGDQPVDTEEFASLKIDADEFEQLWSKI
jgi:hypothetical protein